MRLPIRLSTTFGWVKNGLRESFISEILKLPRNGERYRNERGVSAKAGRTTSLSFCVLTTAELLRRGMK
eukprot:jgi/Botrbrau1/16340/Bobra.0345s0004.1